MKGDRSQPSVVVIGAGMTGILAAIRLQDSGIHDVVVLEKDDKVGGTWYENTYPGVACDVPSLIYTYSFRANPDWSNRIAPGGEIRDYFEQVAGEYGVVEKIHFGEAVETCHFRDDCWHLTTSTGGSYRADFVICATGILHQPAYPDIDGLHTFGKPMWHTARWNHDVDLAGKRVGIIGTGSTACQVIPELAGSVADLTVFQRTAQWICPLPERPTVKRIMPGGDVTPG